MYQHPLPKRVRVLILGGGIHGTGLLHDLASRGWKDVHLIEKSTLAIGTSSRSTKLIHGGLRYLQRLSQFPMVQESLSERQFLLKVAEDIVSPLEIIVPIEKKGQAWFGAKIKVGLTLYDCLAGQDQFHRNKKYSVETVKEKVPILDDGKFHKFYSFWDAQTDDLALVKRVAASAVKLGATITEQTAAVSIKEDPDGWQVTVRTSDGRTETISALYVVNCLGPWSNQFLEQSQITPPYAGFNNKGVHIVYPDLGLKAGLFLHTREDERVFFMLPWQNYTLIGTTESLYEGSPDQAVVTEEEIRYLLDSSNYYLKTPLREQDIITSFAGLRWLAIEKNKSLSATSRETVVGETPGTRGLLLTLYGGKLTSYRALSQKMGDRLTHHFGQFIPSQTRDPEAWASKDEAGIEIPSVIERFKKVI
jgi:glycerol-3-phosphate dehydrogenase